MRFFSCCVSSEKESKDKAAAEAQVKKITDPFQAFSYRMLNKDQKQSINSAGYASIYTQGFFQLVDMTINDNNLERDSQNGWKFQISLDEDDSELPGSNLEKGWDIVLKHIINNRIYHTKVVPQGVSLHKEKRDVEGFERGKQITIYAHRDIKNSEEWKRILQEINDDLVTAQIIPSFRPPSSSKAIPGSNYITYRNDLGSDGSYDVSAKFNNGDHLDPYADIMLEEKDNQLEPSLWKNKKLTQSFGLSEMFKNS
jgi:hypothetical protein